MEILAKIKYIFLSVALSLLFVSCGTKKSALNKQADNYKIANYAKRYLGTPYQYGGTSRNGLDCSGLIQLSYSQFGYNMPRTTKQLSKVGKKTKQRKAKAGDLIFFRTLKRSRKKSHVGLITLVEGDEIEFIHSSSSRGVIISSLSNPYWRKNFAEIRRYIK